MTVRAKFQVLSVTRTRSSISKRQPDGKYTYEMGEMQTVKLSPVTGGNTEENERFWASTPSGVIELGVMNAEAGNYFELGAEYYVDFSKAE